MADTLHTEELKSLHKLSASQKYGTVAISPEHREKLLWCGYVSERQGTLAITPAGQAKLEYETTRASWFPASA